MHSVNMHEAKTHFSRLVESVIQSGEEIVIAKAGKPAARLVPLREGAQRIQFGLMQGEIEIGRDFDAPLPQETLATFEGEK